MDKKIGKKMNNWNPLAEDIGDKRSLRDSTQELYSILNSKEDEPVR